MVNLPKESKEANPQGIELFRLNNFHMCIYNEPVTLLELEEMAERGTHYLRLFFPERYTPIIKQYLMNRLRRIYNLEFKIRCDACGTAHDQDEITAPER